MPGPWRDPESPADPGLDGRLRPAPDLAVLVTSGSAGGYALWMSRRFEGRPVQALAFGLIALSVALGAWAGGAAAAPRAPQASPDTAAASRVSTAASRALVGIDTRNRAAVKRAYQRRLAPNLNVPIRWTGSNAGCHAGRASHASRAATLESLNFVRALGHLAPVTFTRRLSAKAQQAALIMSANGALSHDPPRSWKCWTRAGSNAAGHSNLAYGLPTLTAGATIVQYMTDPGETNYFAGHRRWLMYPYTAHMGNGATTQTNAIWVLNDTVLSRPDPAWVGWPTAGWFPAPLEPAGRWSLSASDDSVSFANARVRVTNAAGQRLRTHVEPVAVGYGKATVVWQVRGIKATGVYHVTVAKITSQSKPHGFSHTYIVRMFSPRRG